jgi:DNA-directed RNA polymerase subunit alpha
MLFSKKGDSMLTLETITPRIETLEQSGTFGKFVVEPLEPGYGLTLGNSLRRVLLSSIHGAAITSVRVQGVQHEFQTIPGIKEDATELILNLKELAVKMHLGEESDETDIRTIRIEKRGAGRVTGIDVQCPSDVEIGNPDLYIATLSEETSSLFIEMRIERGRGYVAANAQRFKSDVIGDIPVGSAFGPINKVNFVVDPTRVGNRTDYERLTMEITSNGTISPMDALSQAAQVLSDYFIRFAGISNLPRPPRLSDPGVNLPAGAIEARIEELDFSVRTYNCLKKANVLTIGELTQISEDDLLNIRNFGRKSLTEVKEKLTVLGLALKGGPATSLPDEDDEE